MTTIKIAVTGACGNMGRLIIQNMLKYGNMKLVSAIDVNNIGKDIGDVIGVGKLNILIDDPNDIANVLERSNPDVLIDFSIANAAVNTIIAASSKKIDLIVGTTGFSFEQKKLIEESIKSNGISAVISPNFSIGMNVYLRLIEEAAKRLENYDVEIIEAHHNQKKDAPSGSALKIAEIISRNVGITKFVHGRQGISPRKKEIGIHSVRGGDIVGDHIVLFAGNGERIEIKHQVNSRQSFVNGILVTIEWIFTADPGIYEIKDVLKT